MKRSRRYLPKRTPFQRAEMAVKMEPLIAAEAKENMKAGGRNKGCQKSDDPIDIKKLFARVAGVAPCANAVTIAVANLHQ